MSNYIELLAPAGNKENFIGAINAGANAVYLAGKQFGARAYASNFTNDELSELIKYAHLRNVKVFVTVNTIIFENEINELLTYTDFLVRNQVDALIVQDIGIIELLVKRYPNTEIHASTQMNVYNIHQAKYLKNIGVSRIILARETDIDTIKLIKQEVNIELEVFIHGALCVSYSGNCLFSALNGGRSGNRGQCAQPCRLPYTLLKEDKPMSDDAYLMSTKDLLSINHLQEIIEAGVSSLKIEGRMRSFEYVTQTVQIYRNAIDTYFLGTYNHTSDQIKKLKTVFNREYTKGYISNESPYDINNSYRPNHLGIEVGRVVNFKKGKTTIKLTDTLSKNDGIRIIGTKDIGGKVNKIVKNNEVVDTAYKGDTIIIDMLGSIAINSVVRKTMDVHLNKDLSIYNATNYKLVPLYIEVTSFVGNQLSIKMQTPFTKEVTTTSDYVVKQAKNKPQTTDDLITQFSKLGNTYYKLESIKINTDEEGFIPNSVINELRRNGIANLENTILNKTDRIFNVTDHLPLQKTPYHKELIVKVENKEQYQVAKELGIKTIYFKDNMDDNYIFMNRIHYDVPNDNKLVIQDYGLLDQTSKSLITNEHLNVVNSYSVISLLSKGAKYITLSHESTMDNTRDLIKQFYKQYGFNPPLEVIVYSTPDLMISKYCPITKALGINKLNCGACEHNQYYLKDKEGSTYPLIRDHRCNIRVLHKKVINDIHKLKSYLAMGINRVRLEFTTESKEKTKQIIMQYQKKWI